MYTFVIFGKIEKYLCIRLYVCLSSRKDSLKYVRTWKVMNIYYKNGRKIKQFRTIEQIAWKDCQFSDRMITETDRHCMGNFVGEAHHEKSLYQDGL